MSEKRIMKELLQSARILEDLTTNIDLIDAQDENLIAILDAVVVMMQVRALSEDYLPGVISAAYVAGRLRGRQEWTIKMGEKDE